MLLVRKKELLCGVLATSMIVLITLFKHFLGE